MLFKDWPGRSPAQVLRRIEMGPRFFPPELMVRELLAKNPFQLAAGEQCWTNYQKKDKRKTEGQMQEALGLQ